MEHPICDVNVGTHSEPFWRDTNTNLVVCDHHKQIYQAREDEFGPFAWEQIKLNNIFDVEDDDERCLSRRPNGRGIITHCSFKKDHDGPHSWVPY